MANSIRFPYLYDRMCDKYTTRQILTTCFQGDAERMQPLISVVIAAYNESKHLARALTSLISQTYPEVEIVFVNDGSTDSTLDEAAAFLARSGANYKLISLDSNSGVSKARNVGIDEASGEFATFLDADDYISENLLEELYKAAAKCFPAADMTICGYSVVEDGKITKHPIAEKFFSPLPTHVMIESRILNKIEPALSVLYSKAFLLASRIVYTDGCRAGEDGEFIMKALSVSRKTVICGETGYFYVQHDEMSSRRFHGESKIERYHEHTEAQARAAEFIAGNSGDPALLKLVSALIMPIVTMRRMSYLAMKKDRGAFNGAFRQIDSAQLLKSSAFLFKKPEIFLRAIFLLVLPGVYYNYYMKRYV